MLVPNSSGSFMWFLIFLVVTDSCNEIPGVDHTDKESRIFCSFFSPDSQFSDGEQEHPKAGAR